MVRYYVYIIYVAGYNCYWVKLTDRITMIDYLELWVDSVFSKWFLLGVKVYALGD